MSEESLSTYEFPKFEYLIDSLLPTQEIHLIGGPTGAGKTTWLLRLLDQWRKGEAVFGHASHPAPFLYISLDRSRNGMLRIFQRMHIDPSPFRMIFPSLHERNLGLPLMLRKYASANKDAKLLVVEGFQTGVENINDQKEVTTYLSQVQALCIELDITILGVVHTSKSKQNAKYENPRERIAGCMQWGGWSETIIMIEPKVDQTGMEADVRTLQILPRNGKPVILSLEFKDGLLVPQTKHLSNEQKILAYCANRPGEQTHSLDDFRAVTGLGDSQLASVVAILVQNKRLTRLERNKYSFSAPSSQA